jgi:aminopeptidase N
LGTLKFPEIVHHHLIKLYLAMLQSHFDADNGHKSFELPGARPHYTPDRPGQVEHIFLDLRFDIPNQSYAGTCTTRLNPIRSGLDRFTLDAVNLTIHSVTIANIAQPFDYDGHQLQIRLTQPTTVGQRIELAIAYAVEQPQRGIYFITPTPDYPNKPIQVWTQGEDEDSRFWFPCFDYPGQLATSEIRVGVPAEFRVISNGELIKIEVEGDQKIYHWHQQQVHPTYLMTLAIGDFAEIKDDWQGKPVTYYVKPGDEASAQISMGKTPQMIEFFSQLYGYPYPYPKYAQVCVDDFIFGGMENTSTTLLMDRCLLDERAAIDNRSTETLVAHELAHQWFGDLVVIKHWAHAWIKEGMASYAEVLWIDREYGPDEAAYYLLGEARSYLEEDASRYRRPLVTHVYREAIELYDRHIYEKGACVYHMLRAELGDDLFWRAIAQFLQTHAHSTVETIDLLRAIETATGRNLTFLFDQYVYRGGHPDYKVAYAWDSDSQLAKITVTQTQADKDRKDLFDLKIPIGFGYLTQPEPTPQSNQEPVATGLSPLATLKTLTVRVHELEQSFYFPLEQKPDFISFDRGNDHLKTVTLEYPLPELKAQLEADPDPISRIYAAAALAKQGSLEAVKALTKAGQNDSFWGVRAEIYRNLSTIKLDQVLDGLLKGLHDPEARVRRAVVESLAQITTQESYQALTALVVSGDPSYYVEAAALRGIGTLVATGLLTPQAEPALKLLQTVLKERQGWNEVVRSGAIGALSQMKTSVAALDVILAYTLIGTPQPLRLSAIRALGTISTGQETANLERILAQLHNLSRETFFLTQVAVTNALGQMETPRAIGILQTLADQSADGRIRRIAEEAIQKVQKKVGSDQAVKQIREELDQLKKENQTLKSRLETLEAKAGDRAVTPE